MKSIYWAAWSAFHSAGFGNGEEIWAHVLQWRCDGSWEEAKPEFMHTDPRNTMRWRRAHSGRRQPWEKPFLIVLGPAWQESAIASSRPQWKAGESDFIAKWSEEIGFAVPTDTEKSPITGASVRVSAADCIHIDGNPWHVQWGTHDLTQLEVLGDNALIIDWTRGRSICNTGEHKTRLNVIVERMAVLQASSRCVPRNPTAHWCRHVYRHWNKESDAQANIAIDTASSNTWTHPEAHRKAQQAKIFASFDGAFRTSTSESGAGWNVWIADGSGTFTLMANGH
eukprot:1471640-Karenia_brevis.AAC.1